MNEKIRSLNEEQRNLFDFVSSWTRNLLKSLRIKGAEKPDPFHIFLTGSAGCGKSHTLTTIRYYLEKALSYGSGELTKERMLMLAPTGVAAVHVDGSTIHSALGIVPDRKKSKQVSRISDKKKCSLRQRFSELKVIIIDEISMVSNHLLLYIHQRLTDILGCNDGTPFAGVSIITCGDFYQLPPIRASPVYAKFIGDQTVLNIEHIWRTFKISELTEVMRQRGDQIFIDLLNNIREGFVTEYDIKILMSRFISKNDPDYPSEAIHIWSENSLVNDHNQQKLSELSGIEYELLAIDKLPDNITEAALNQVYERSQMDTGGLAHKLTIKLKAKVMITANINIGDKLCNGQIGTIEHIKHDHEGNITTVYLKMEEENVGLKTMDSDTFGRVHKLVPINRVEKEIRIRKNGNASSPSIRRLQFPLMLSWACTVHKVQGKTFPKIVFSFDLLKQRSFNNGQVYVALSRVTSLNGLYLTGNFDKKHIRFDQRASDEYDYMRDNSYLKPIEVIDDIDENSLTFTLLNTRSLSKHSIDIKHDKSIMNSDIIFFTETQLLSTPSDTIYENLDPFMLSVNNLGNDRFIHTAIAYREEIVSDEYSIPGASLFTISKPSFSEICLNVILIYRKNSTRHEHVLSLIDQLQEQIFEGFVHIILGDFNINARRVIFYVTTYQNMKWLLHLLLIFQDRLLTMFIFIKIASIISL